MTINLHPDLEAALHAAAEASGVTEEEFIHAALEEKLCEEHHSGFDSPEIEDAWMKEISRRTEEIDSGQVVGIPAEQVFAGIRQMLRERRAAS